MDPTYDELKAYIDDGHTQIEAAQRFYPDSTTSAGRSRVQRIIKRGEDHRGPTERLVDALIVKWGPLDEVKAARAQTLRNYAIMADNGCVMRTGAAMAAGVQANRNLEEALAALGESSGVEDLKAFLLSDDG